VFYAAPVGKLNEMGFRPFDAVIGTSPLNQLSDDEVRTFCNGAHYVLKPGGRIFTIDSGYVEGHSWLTRLFTSMDRGKCDRTLEECQDLLSAACPQRACHVQRFRMILFIDQTMTAIESDHD